MLNYNLFLIYKNMYIVMGIEEKERLIDLLDSISNNKDMWDKFTKSLFIDNNSNDIVSLEKTIKHVCDIEEVIESTSLSLYQKQYISEIKNKLFNELNKFKNIFI